MGYAESKMRRVLFLGKYDGDGMKFASSQNGWNRAFESVLRVQKST